MEAPGGPEWLPGVFCSRESPSREASARLREARHTNGRIPGAGTRGFCEPPQAHASRGWCCNKPLEVGQPPAGCPTLAVRRGGFLRLGWDGMLRLPKTPFRHRLVSGPGAGVPHPRDVLVFVARVGWDVQVAENSIQTPSCVRALSSQATEELAASKRARLQSCRKQLTIEIGGFSLRGMPYRNFARNHKFFRSLKSPTFTTVS